MKYKSLSGRVEFTIDDVKELATVPKYNILPRFFDTIFCHYRVCLTDGWTTVDKDTFYKIRRHRYSLWKWGKNG